jgi:hypothetical protein
MSSFQERAETYPQKSVIGRGDLIHLSWLPWIDVDFIGPDVEAL